MAGVHSLKISVDSSEIKKIISAFNEVLEARDSKIDDLLKRVESLERCPAIESDLG